MNKSKFKTVNWKHGNTQMHSLMENDCKYYWQSDLFPFAGKHGFMKVPEDFIEQYPELFEVEKADREFEEGAYYWAVLTSLATLEIIQFSGGVFHRMGINSLYTEKEFFAIGERIEL